MHRFLHLPLLALLLIASPFAQSGETPRARHVVLFLVDDLGWQDISVPHHTETTPFNKRYRTPHAERLAREGLVLRHGYASAPVCTPTRTSIHSGRSPARTHITYWTLYADRDQTRPWKRGDGSSLIAPAWDLNGLGQEDATLARIFSDAGFRTIHAGKAHLGAIGSSGEDPLNLGFDVNIAGHAPGGPGSYYGLHGFRSKGRQGKPGKSVWDVPGLKAYHHHDVYLTEAISVETCRAVREAARDNKRLFLSFAPYAVHAPIMANKKYLQHYPDLDRTEAAYATMVETVDHALGALLSTLQDEGMLKDTLFVYTSDNGGLSAHGRGGERHIHNAPLRSGKGSAYEGGVRVPWIIRWPGVVQQGTVSDEPVISHDLYPTLLAAAGVSLPRDDGRDGVDLAALLSGEDLRREHPLLWHMPHFWGVNGPGIQPYSALRQGNLKLLFFQGDGRIELYDVSADPGEAQDLATERPQETQRLAQLLAAELQRRGAQAPLLKGGGHPLGVLAALAKMQR
ncbi:MAG: sulfatase [Planctomycetes bacterium]|nr:sulfatase [Planctomycetota bacterium]